MIDDAAEPERAKSCLILYNAFQYAISTVRNIHSPSFHIGQHIISFPIFKKATTRHLSFAQQATQMQISLKPEQQESFRLLQTLGKVQRCTGKPLQGVYPAAG